MQQRLERSTTNKVIAGVCGGIAEYLQVDPTLVRAFFVIGGILTGGLLILGYIVLLIFMPLPGQPQPFVKRDAAPGSAAAAPSAEADAAGETTVMTQAAPVPEDPAAAERRRATIGYVLVALGAIFLLSNTGIFRIVRWDLIWPLVIIGVGVLLLAQRARR